MHAMFGICVHSLNNTRFNFTDGVLHEKTKYAKLGEQVPCRAVVVHGKTSHVLHSHPVRLMHNLHETL
jgi:hypothetical protein